MALARSLYYNGIGDEGAKHLSEGLKENKALTSLKYAAAHVSLPSAALDVCASCVLTLSCSMAYNDIGDEGAKHIAEGLKENKALTELKCAATNALSLHQSLSCLNVVLCSLLRKSVSSP